MYSLCDQLDNGLGCYQMYNVILVYLTFNQIHSDLSLKAIWEASEYMRQWLCFTFQGSTINILQACANGSIPVTQLFEQQAVSVQNLLSGTYGDLILDARTKREKTKKDLKAMDEAENDKRFSFQKPMFSKIRDYINQNAIQGSLKMKVSDSKKRPNLSLVEALEFDNLVSSWFEQT